MKRRNPMTGRRRRAGVGSHIRPQGHPVRSFVAMAVGVGALLLAAAWTGVANPRLASDGRNDWVLAGSDVYLPVVVRNDGAVGVQVTGAASTYGVRDRAIMLSPGAMAAQIMLGRGESSAAPHRVPFRPLTIPSGESRTFYVTVPDICPPGQFSSVVRFSGLDLTVRAPLGLRMGQTVADGGGVGVHPITCRQESRRGS